MRWFFLMLSGEKAGPMTIEEVLAHVEEGAADKDTPYWEEGLGDWAPLSTLLPDLSQPAPGSPVVSVGSTNQPAVPAVARATPATPDASVSAQSSLAQIQYHAAREQTGGKFVFAAWLLLFSAIILGLFQFVPALLVLSIVCAVGAVAFGLIGVGYRRVFGGLTVALLALALPALTIMTIKQTGATPFGLGRAKSSPRLVAFSDETYKREGGAIVLTGTVRNVSDQPLSPVTVLVDWLTKNKEVIHTSAVTVVSSGQLAPGASVRYRIAQPVDKRMDHFGPRRVSFTAKAVALAEKQAKQRVGADPDAAAPGGEDGEADKGTPEPADADDAAAPAPSNGATQSIEGGDDRTVPPETTER